MNNKVGNQIEARLFGTDMFGEVIKPKASGPIAERFIFPPFSILDTRQGEWQKRKDLWLSMGIQGETGRESKTYNIHDWMNNKAGGERGIGGGISIFDPVLCEMAYRWFCPPGGQIIDPFAGGSVRGIVAATLGMRYWGCDLRKEQIEANHEQAKLICPDNPPTWICGDSVKTLLSAPEADFVFSCPPYGNLEKYSDDPNDLSTMEWNDFLLFYSEIISRSLKKLKNDSFACFVVGNFRKKDGFYRNLVGETIRWFENCNVYFYNECILVNMTGSAPIRATKQFNSGRKVVMVHQNILVFVKGDWKNATKKIVGTEVEQ